jgi:acetyltransferase-like isoleucine patch superfamily enzyme
MFILARIIKMLSLSLLQPFNVVIGDGTWIGSVTIMEGARIGKNCNIFPGAVISAVPQV